MKTRTELQIEYAFLSMKYDFGDDIELALENDYVVNPHLYDENALKRVAALLLIAPDASPECALSMVRNSGADHTSI